MNFDTNIKQLQLLFPKFEIITTFIPEVFIFYS